MRLNSKSIQVKVSAVLLVSLSLAFGALITVQTLAECDHVVRITREVNRNQTALIAAQSRVGIEARDEALIENVFFDLVYDDHTHSDETGAAHSEIVKLHAFSGRSERLKSFERLDAPEIPDGLFRGLARLAVESGKIKQRRFEPLTIIAAPVSDEFHEDVIGAVVIAWDTQNIMAQIASQTLLPFWLAALIGAIVTATDPVAASPIVTGSVAEKNIPERIRHAVSFESGANDGLSYLFVFFAFLMLTRATEEALSHWMLHTLLWEVGVASLFGLAIGYLAAKLLLAADRHGAIKSDWRLVYTAALALFAVGAGRLIGSDEVLVVFAAGAAFAQVASTSERENEERGQEAVNRFFAIPIFIVLGTALPWEGWSALGWSGVVLVIAVLLLRRPPVLLLLRPLLPGIRSVPDALFVGWFGPIAVAAIYYASLMEHRLGEPVIWHVVSLVICGSVIAHGLTGAPLTRLYGRKTGHGLEKEGAARKA